MNPRTRESTKPIETLVRRRDFLRTASKALIGFAATSRASTARSGDRTTSPIARPLAWGYLLHLSYNMWEDWIAPEKETRGYRPVLRLDEALWNDVVHRMAAVGMNMVVIDLGDGVRYERHPEIAIQGAWPVAKLKAELVRLRRLGLEPIPKLNFSTCHDAWLGKYERMVSTDEYYAVCGDLVAEVVALFDRPRFFHLGMDEEGAEHQKYYRYVAFRQHDLWWHDLRFLCDRVVASGSRPWIWSDYLWNHVDAFFDRMPRSVLQSNWYYDTDFSRTERMVQAYDALEAHGFDQVPTASNHAQAENFALTVDYCRNHIAPERLVGFLQTRWRPTIEEYRRDHLAAIDEVGKVIARVRASAVSGSPGICRDDIGGD